MQEFDSACFLIDKSEEGERLDKILVARFEGKFSRTYFQSLIDQKLVRVGGLPVKKRERLREGDEVELFFANTQEPELTSEYIPFEVLYEDDWLLAINKPAGLVVHPGAGNWSHTFVNGLLYYCKELEREGKSFRPGIVHRLDKETSGVLIAAKTIEAQQKMIELFASRQVYKEYIAVCLGRPPEGEIEAPIGRDPIHRKQMAVLEKGKRALSVVKLLHHSEAFSVVQVVIKTGRTHQIRVHLKHKGAPILGDSLYGSLASNRKFAVERQLLHALKIAFRHPFTQIELELSAPIPEDFSRFYPQE